jgi:hypothetical protein
MATKSKHTAEYRSSLFVRKFVIKMPWDYSAALCIYKKIIKSVIKNGIRRNMFEKVDFISLADM